MRELIYPSQARRTGVQGVVEIVFIINMDGTIREAAVRKRSRHAILDEEALRAVQSAAPFRKPETPVKIVIPVSFTLT
jgi:protein TonB